MENKPRPMAAHVQNLLAQAAHRITRAQVLGDVTGAAKHKAVYESVKRLAGR